MQTPRVLRPAQILRDAEGGTDGIADEHDGHDANDAGHETDHKGTGHCSSTERGPLPWVGGLIGIGLLFRRRR